ncbi:MAG: methyl-accepting chemotaxis protein [Vulcanimicrobiaceae bacterium]
MKDWTIRQLIIGSFGVILALIVVTGGVAAIRLAAVQHEAANLQRDSLPGVYQSSAMLALWEVSHELTIVRALQPDTRLHGIIDRHLQGNTVLLNNLNAEYGAALFGPRDRETFQAYNDARVAYERSRPDFLAQHFDARPSAVAIAARNRFRRTFGVMHNTLETMIAFNEGNADASAATIKDDTNIANISILGSIAIALILAFGCGYFLLRRITATLGDVAVIAKRIGDGDLTVNTTSRARRGEIGLLTQAFDTMVASLSLLVGQVQRSGISVSSSVTEIAATAKQQQAAASETAATVTEVGATSREIAATSRELVKTMGEVSLVAEQTAALAGNGQAELARMEETMRTVVDAATSINAKLATLSEKAGNITLVVATITKVADQTNLLSLNAAIEAEKAGEYGRGFSVVATEIRRLADQTAIATFDIEQMVRDIQSAVSAGVMGMDKFSDQVRRGMQEVQAVGGQLAQIIHQVQALAPQVEFVNEGMQAQAGSAEQITQALVQLSEAAKQTVQSLQQSGQVIDELSNVSTRLRDGVSGFKLGAAA